MSVKLDGLSTTELIDKIILELNLNPLTPVVHDVCRELGYDHAEVMNRIHKATVPQWENINDEIMLRVLHRYLPFFNSLNAFCRAANWPYQRVYQRLRALKIKAVTVPHLVQL